MTLISYTYNPVNGDPEDIGQLMANLNTIKSVVNGNLDNTNIAAGAAIDLAKLAQNGATNGQVPVWNSASSKWIPGAAGGGGGGGAFSFIDHQTFTSDVTIPGSAINEGTAQSVKSTLSKPLVSSGTYIVEFYCPSVAMSGAASITIILLRDTTVLGKIAILDGSSVKASCHTVYRDVNPTTTNHTYTVKAYVPSGSGGTIGAGNGGSGNNVPGFIRLWQES